MMKKESLIKARSRILDTLENLDIEYLDKAELCLNLYKFLDENMYQSNIEKLKQKDDKQITIDEYIKTLKKEKKKNE